MISGRARGLAAGGALGAIALACAVLQLNGALHHLLVAHVHCAQHGELVHGHAADHGAAAAPLSGAAMSSRGEAELDHEHCVVALRPRGAVAPLSNDAAAIVQPRPSPSPPAESVLPSQAPLSRAPKTSPPV